VGISEAEGCRRSLFLRVGVYAPEFPAIGMWRSLLWVAVGGFILALGIILIVGGYIAGPNAGVPTPIAGTSGNGTLHWYGPNLILLGATISPIRAVILAYGVAVKSGRRISSPA